MSARNLSLFLLILAGACTQALAETAPEAAPFSAKADALAQTYVTTGHFAGNVVIAYAGKVVFRKSYGLADRAWATPVTSDTAFRIGSTTKMFTAVAILQLVQAGKLSLDAPVRTYLSEAPESWNAVTLRHLLSHGSGIPEYLSTTNSFRKLVRTDRSPEDILALLHDLPLQFTPGTKYTYSNSNFVALGLIIERQSGQTYVDYISDHILKPLHMSHTGYYDPTQITARLAQGYIAGDKSVQNMFYISPTMIYAAGNLYSTADDLLIWDHALHDNNALGLDPTLKSLMFKDNGFGYGYGAFIDKVDEETYVGHGGTLPGFNTDYERFTRLPLTIILQSNTYPTDIDKMTRDMASLFFKTCGKTDPAKRCKF